MQLLQLFIDIVVQLRCQLAILIVVAVAVAVAAANVKCHVIPKLFRSSLFVGFKCKLITAKAPRTKF